MINRIIIIGNGFDLAHGMKTSYKDFFGWYWDYIKTELIHSIDRHNSKYEINTKLCTITLRATTFPWYEYLTRYQYTGFVQVTGIDFYNKLSNDKNVRIECSPFFERICKSVENKNWVDIENEYYMLLKEIALKKSTYTIDELNNDLEYIKQKLIAYLKEAGNDRIEKHIKEEISSSLKRKDMSLHGKKLWDEFTSHRLKWSDLQWYEFIERYNPKESKLDNISIQHLKSDIEEEIKDFKYVGNEDTFITRPDNILFLDFNYTDTISRYITKESHFAHIHIHGNSSDLNSIILGYGDELDEDFKNIENLNDNKYLKNVKSTCYLESDNYSRLLEFVDSAPYQVIVMGHSCGNSDRTLLNTLFEHENCISIKPYYYEYIDKNGLKNDNYTDIVQNIYRNFTNKALVREKVVNKTYCKPLIPLPIDNDLSKTIQ